MLGYFRINDPYRLVIIFVLLLVFKVPFYITSDWLTVPELRWLLVGERINDGALLYVDFWTETGFLSAWVYAAIDWLFGRSRLALQLFGLVLFYFQIFYINFLALKHKMYNENNYIPGLIYGVGGLIFFNLTILSPVLMGLTFVLFSLNNLLSHIESRNRTDANLLNIGLYTGIAALFYLPYAWVFAIHALILVFFTNTLARRYLLMIYGVIIPLALSWLFYIWKNQTGDYYYSFVFSLFRKEANSFVSYKTIFTAAGFTILLYVIGSLKTLNSLGFNIFQVRIQKTMFFASVVFAFIWYFYGEKAGYGMVMFLPWIAFFLTHFFFSIRNNLKRELTVLVYLISIIIGYSAIALNLFPSPEFVSYNDLKIKSPEIAPVYQNTKVLVLGPDIKPYLQSKPATRYFDWELSKKQLSALSYYDNLEAIDRNIRSDMPDFIIDQVEIAPKIFDKIPLLAKEYSNRGGGIYQRVVTNN